jgi:hypothetical protein
MPGTTTTRLALYKPDATGVDNVNVVTDINNNADNLDSKVGFVACTSGTRPGSPYNGHCIRETDTSKYYVWNGATWPQALIGTASFDSDITMSAVARRVIIGGAGGSASFASKRTAVTDEVVSGHITGDTTNRWSIQADGKWQIGAGGVAAFDTNLYRSATDTLKTDDNFITNIDHTINGRFFLGSRRYNNQLSAVTTVANSTTETVVATYTIAANDMIAGAIYRINVRGLASVLAATTPTMIWRGKISGLAGTVIASSSSITSSSGVTNKPWEVDLYISCVTTGASGTIRGIMKTIQTLSVAGAAPSAAGTIWMDGTSAVTVDTTISRDLVITVQWGAASASNTLSAYVVTAERVA